MKTINDKHLEIKLTVFERGSDGVVDVSGEAQYTVLSDDLSTSRTLSEVNITNVQKMAIKNFALNILGQIKDTEGIS